METVADQVPDRSRARRAALLALDAGVGVLAAVTLIRGALVGLGDRPWQAWLGLTGLPESWVWVLRFAFAGSVIGWAFLPARVRPAARWIVGLAGVGCLADAWRYQDLLGRRELFDAAPMSLSLPTAALTA